ncbi:hypothetical protein [Mammaliicoccus sciuri]|uniref:hypothetical protein n=1 Tax=Mammaliicoccus sciuri TaxID=1296 RepID=UPI002B2626D9|nr:hypothetical protein [Mammaliicoccus sciuri]WQK64279.1 hypothetical protein P3U20_04865 [Mammaliicoccus sciuri]
MKLKVLKITLLIVILAEEIRSVIGDRLIRLLTKKVSPVNVEKEYVFPKVRTDAQDLLNAFQSLE